MDPDTSAISLPAGYRLAAFDEIDSTSDEVRRRARAGATPGLIVWARRQTRGRGRRGRTWVSPEGNLYLSVLLAPGGTLAAAAQISFVAALALAETISLLGSGATEPTFKWPNDVLIGGRKVAGILLETLGGEAGEDRLIVGIGLNLASHPEDARFPATSLRAEGWPAVAPEQALAAFIPCFDRWLGRWQQSGFASLRRVWLDHATALGEDIEVTFGGQRLIGTFRDIDGDGALVLDDSGGARHVIRAGDVFFDSSPPTRQGEA